MVEAASGILHLVRKGVREYVRAVDIATAVLDPIVDAGAPGQARFQFRKMVSTCLEVATRPDRDRVRVLVHLQTGPTRKTLYLLETGQPAPVAGDDVAYRCHGEAVDGGVAWQAAESSVDGFLTAVIEETRAWYVRQSIADRLLVRALQLRLPVVRHGAYVAMVRPGRQGMDHWSFRLQDGRETLVELGVARLPAGDVRAG